MDHPIFIDPIAFEQPHRITQEVFWVGHIPFAFWLIAQLKPRIFVELGTYRGDSYSSFCQAVDKLKLDTRCFAVDNWKGDLHYGQYSEDIYTEIKTYHDAKYLRFSKLIRADFDEAVNSFEDNSIDLLHIDGTHTYEAVRHDFETWKPKLSNRAIVLFHDIAVTDKDYGVGRYWEELGEYPSLEFTHSSGLGVLFYGNDIPSDLLRLTSESEQTKKWFSDFFQCLGERIIAQSTMLNQRAYYEEMIENIKKELYSTRTANDLFNVKIEDLENMLSFKQSHIEALQSGLKSRQSIYYEQLTGLEQKNLFKQSYIDALKHGAYARKIIHLEQINKLKHEITFQQYYIDALKSGIQNRESYYKGMLQSELSTTA